MTSPPSHVKTGAPKDEKPVANHKQAEKRNPRRLKRRQRNLMYLSAMRTHIKRVRNALDGSDNDAAKAGLPVAVRAIDRAASKGSDEPSRWR